MRILITGAMGYIGTELLGRLSKQTHSTIYALDNSVENLKFRSGSFLRFPNIKFINGDVTDRAQLKSLPRVDLIIHLASVVGYISCSETPKLALETNINGTQNIAKLNTPTIFLSTGSVYGEIGDICDESVDLNPQTLYAITKMQGEEIIRDIKHTILRPATAYGLSYKVRHDLLIHNLARIAVEKGEIDLYQPQAMRSFYSVQKIAELIEYICFNFNKFEGRTLNVGCESGNLKKIDIAKMIAKHTETNIVTRKGKDLDTRDYNVNYSILSNLWRDYEESIDSHIEQIVGYYKLWKKY